LRVAEDSAEARAAFHGERHHRLEAFVDGGRVFKGRPIEETHAIEFFLAVGIDIGGETLEQGG